MTSKDEDNPLAALGPIAWDAVDHDELSRFLADTFASAQLLADSIPASSTASSTASGSGGRPRSQTDGAVSYGLHPTAPTTSDTIGLSREEKAALISNQEKEKKEKNEKLRQDLRQSWKEVRTGGANPREIMVYKMNGGRDGYAGSSWFARRSIHRVEKAKASKSKDAKDGQDIEIEFDMFRQALLKEFALPGQEDQSDTEEAEAKGKGASATSTVRTMTTKKRVEHVVVDGRSHGAGQNVGQNDGDHHRSTRQLDVYLLEAEFPGPTATRDFVTMLLTAQSPCPSSLSSSSSPNRHVLRQFMLVSKPCEHPDTPNRPGYVRAQYESVEMIREVRVPVVASAKSAKTLSAGNTRRTQSSIDLSRGYVDADSDLDADTHETAIEWLMITRNNPGGSVPRFLVDKSTPSSIISDANKFMDWLVAQEVEARKAKESLDSSQVKYKSEANLLVKTPLESAIPEEDEEELEKEKKYHEQTHDTSTVNNNVRVSTSPSVTILHMDGSGGAASSAKLFNMFAGALGGAGTAVASKLPNPFGGAVEALHSSFEGHRDGDDDDDIVDDDSGGDTYSDIDDDDEVDDEVDDEKVRGRSRRPTQDETKTQETASTNTTNPNFNPSLRSAGSSSMSSIPPPPPTTALEMLAHSRAIALRRLDGASAAGLSTGSSRATSDNENDTETGVGDGRGAGSNAKKKKVDQAAAKAAKATKAAEAAQKRHERELRKLQDRQRKAEEDILKAKKVKLKGGDEEEVGSIKSASESGVPTAVANSSSSSLSIAPSSAAAARTEIQKLREKHDRTIARQEAQYQKEMEKLERKRQQQADKEAARLRKQQEREEKTDTARQLVHARAERDVARKETEVLEERVRQLEAKNRLLTMEVAQLTGEAKGEAKEDAEVQ